MSTTPSALVLGGGGILGAAWEIGVLASLEERYGTGAIARSFDMVLGTSAGSFVAAVVCQGLPPERLYTAFRDHDPELMVRPHDVARVRWTRLAGAAGRFLQGVLADVAASLVRWRRPSLLDVFSHGLDRLPAGFLCIDGLERYLCRLFEREGLSNSFQALHRRLLIPAVDIDAGTVTVFGEEPASAPTICRAVTASSAIPQLFAPVPVDGRQYVDGAVGGATHLEIVLGHHPRWVLFLNPVVASCEQAKEAGTPSSCRPVSRSGLGTVIDQAMKVQQEAAVASSLRAVRARYPAIPVLDIQPPRHRMPAAGLMQYDAHLAALEAGHMALTFVESGKLAELDRMFLGRHSASEHPGGATRGSSSGRKKEPLL